MPCSSDGTGNGDRYGVSFWSRLAGQAEGIGPAKSVENGAENVTSQVRISIESLKKLLAMDPELGKFPYLVQPDWGGLSSRPLDVRRSCHGVFGGEMLDHLWPTPSE